VPTRCGIGAVQIIVQNLGKCGLHHILIGTGLQGLNLIDKATGADRDDFRRVAAFVLATKIAAESNTVAIEGNEVAKDDRWFVLRGKIEPAPRVFGADDSPPALTQPWRNVAAKSVVAANDQKSLHAGGIVLPFTCKKARL